jgi:hypothetical protein
MISTHAQDVAGAIARHIAGVESAGAASRPALARHQ